MTSADLLALLPFLVVGGAAVIVMLAIAFYRNYRLTVVLTGLGLAIALGTLPIVDLVVPRQVTPLVVIDAYALFFLGAIFAATLAVTVLAYDYIRPRTGRREEFYLLLLLATFGAAVLVTSTHFASFFLGLEILSVSLYALIAYERENLLAIEAAVKYLVLAGSSSAFLLLGMALVYGELGTMEFARIATLHVAGRASLAILGAGLALILVGIGFKLALVPFHLWTPDVYQGASAPVAAYIASVSKGAMFALLLRYFKQFDPVMEPGVFAVFTLLAILSMFVGNLLALLQNNVKRLLAYSSITHMGYLLVALLASGPLAVDAVAFYLVTYFITIIGAFGVVTMLSSPGREADGWDNYVGLAWRRPWLGAVFTAMLLSLAGIPLTAGFVGKFYLLTAGVNSSLWLLAILLVINSTIGLFYYLRVVVAIYATAPARPLGEQAAPSAARSTIAGSFTGGVVLAVLTILLVWLGVYPTPLIGIIESMVAQIM
ncbi:MAG: NADH-quinone oxidoreductase subunit N [Thermoguttaceae bacterium]